jgi:hypothetical protein
LKQVQEFQGGRVEEQQLRETKNRKEKQGHLVTYNPFNRLQLDVFILKKYETSNHGISYVSWMYSAVRRGVIP